MKTLLEAIFLSLALLLLGHFCFDYLKESMGIDLVGLISTPADSKTSKDISMKQHEEQEVPAPLVPAPLVPAPLVPAPLVPAPLVPDSQIEELNEFIKNLV
jgi:hypothetical protein